MTLKEVGELLEPLELVLSQVAYRINTVALSCCKGDRQHDSVMRLAEQGFLKRRTVRDRFGLRTTIEPNLDWKSWKGLRARLEAAGFEVRLSPMSGSEVEPLIYIEWKGTADDS